jgi:hypothetical protein
MTLDENIGFKSNPFSKKSSEQEIEFLKEIFFEPNYYNTLLNDLSNGDSRFIIGQRGHGKSSIINKLLDDLENKEVLTIKIERFDSIPIKKNETALLHLIIKKVVTKTAIYLDANKSKLKKLNKIEKEKICLFIRIFFTTLSKTEYTNYYNNFHKVKITNWFIRTFNNWLLKPTNALTSAGMSIGSLFVRDSLGFQNIETDSVYREYFGTIKQIDFDNIDFNQENFNKESLKNILDELLLIIKTIDFKTTVILFDKIDEFQELDSNIDKIAEFASEILTDTELLLNDKLAIGFSLWSELKSELTKVRFDKFESIDIRWKEKDMELIINKRIKYFSINNDLTLDKLISNKNDKEELIKIANKSPRELISVLGTIYNEQSNNNYKVSKFDSQSISKGLINFSSNFDYESIYPSKVGKNRDIKTMINRILKVRQIRFTIKHLTDTFNQRTSQSDGQLKLMIQYKLIKEDDVLGENKIRYYDVIDPKVEFLIRRNITAIE